MQENFQLEFGICDFYKSFRMSENSVYWQVMSIPSILGNLI